MEIAEDKAGGSSRKRQGFVSRSLTC